MNLQKLAADFNALNEELHGSGVVNWSHVDQPLLDDVFRLCSNDYQEILEELVSRFSYQGR